MCLDNDCTKNRIACVQCVISDHILCWDEFLIDKKDLKKIGIETQDKSNVSWK